MRVPEGYLNLDETLMSVAEVNVQKPQTYSPDRERPRRIELKALASLPESRRLAIGAQSRHRTEDFRCLAFQGFSLLPGGALTYLMASADCLSKTNLQLEHTAWTARKRDSGLSLRHRDHAVYPSLLPQRRSSTGLMERS
jgi:hypothetical protein